jgi:hypothetical protein
MVDTSKTWAQYPLRYRILFAAVMPVIIAAFFLFVIMLMASLMVAAPFIVLFKPEMIGKDND